MNKIVKKTLEKSYFRLDMSEEEYLLLVDILNYVGADKRRLKDKIEDCLNVRDSLYQKVENIKQIDTGKKALATDKAHQVKRDASLKKVQLAVKELELVKKTVTAYSVAKIAGISFVTAKKYLDLIKEDDCVQGDK